MTTFQKKRVVSPPGQVTEYYCAECISGGKYRCWLEGSAKPNMVCFGCFKTVKCWQSWLYTGPTETTETPTKENDVNEFNISFAVQAVPAKDGWRGLLKLKHPFSPVEGVPSYPVVLFESEVMKTEQEAQMAAVDALTERILGGIG